MCIRNILAKNQSSLAFPLGCLTQDPLCWCMFTNLIFDGKTFKINHHVLRLGDNRNYWHIRMLMTLLMTYIHSSPYRSQDEATLTESHKIVSNQIMSISSRNGAMQFLCHEWRKNQTLRNMPMLASCPNVSLVTHSLVSSSHCMVTNLYI